MSEKWTQEPQSRHLGKKRNRVRIPKPRYKLDDVPVNNEFWPRSLTSTAKGIGKKVCQQEQQHDLIRHAAGSMGGWFVFCQRCGQLIDYKHD